MTVTSNRFRWAFCQLELLCQALPPSVRHILEELPEGLDETYERILREIGKPNQRHTFRLLQCLVAAIRPLRVKELAEVLAIDFESGGTPILNPGWRWSDHEEAVLLACSSLVMIVENEEEAEDGDSRIVQFSHFSVKEFLMSSRLAEMSKDVSRYHIQLEAAHIILSQACLGVLLRLDDGIDHNSIKSFPMAQYAARYWVEHAQFGNVSLRIEDGMDCLFDADKPHFATWLWIYDEDQYSSLSTERPSKPTAIPLYYAVLHGFSGLVERLFAKHPDDLYAEGGKFATPFMASAHRQHFGLFSRFIDHLPVVDKLVGFGQTALHVAAWTGQLEIGRRLLSCGANVNAREHDDWTPLHFAASWGALNFVRMLLEHDALIDARTSEGGTPLHRAAAGGYIETMQLLSENGANLSARTKDGNTPSDLAISAGQREAAQFLSKCSTKAGLE